MTPINWALTNNVLQTDENGMSFFEVAEYASFDIDQLSA